MLLIEFSKYAEPPLGPAVEKYLMAMCVQFSYSYNNGKLSLSITPYISSCFLYLYLSLTHFFPPPPSFCIIFRHPFPLPVFILQDPVVQFCLATRCGRNRFDLRGRVTGTVNHFYCSLTLASRLPLSARETLFQQMGKTDITINLFFEKE